MITIITVGVLALQGAVYEHIKLLHQALAQLKQDSEIRWKFLEVRTEQELATCDALIIPGGESTTVSLVAARSNLLEPLRDFVKIYRKPTWGTCAGLILLAESANRTKKGGQDLIGGLDVRVNRNHFGRQAESFEAALDLPFLAGIDGPNESEPFHGVFIRAPVVEKILPTVEGEQVDEDARNDTVIAPSREGVTRNRKLESVEIMATLPGRKGMLMTKDTTSGSDKDVGSIIAVRQENVFGISFHPELTKDARIHMWWLKQVQEAIIHR